MESLLPDWSAWGFKILQFIIAKGKRRDQGTKRIRFLPEEGRLLENPRKESPDGLRQAGGQQGKKQAPSGGGQGFGVGLGFRLLRLGCVGGVEEGDTGEDHNPADDGRKGGDLPVERPTDQCGEEGG